MSSKKISLLLLCLLMCGSFSHAAEQSTGALPKVSLATPETDQGEDQDLPLTEAKPQAQLPVVGVIPVGVVPPPPMAAPAGEARGLDNFYGHKKPTQAKVDKGKDKSSAPAAPSKKSSKQVFEDVPLPPTAAEDEFGDQRAIPEVTQKAPMSRSDVNRIVCSEPIKEVLYSAEKGVKVKYNGTNAFVKFNYDPMGDSVVYSDTPTELHVLCGDTTYTIVAVPMALPPQTIRLGSGKEANMRKNTEMFRDDDTNKKIRELLRRTYKDDLPESFTVKQQNIPLSVYRDLSVSLRRTISVDGEGILVKEFVVVSNVDGIELREKQFLKREISANPAAIAIEPGKLRPARGEKVRLFVVEFKGAEEGNANVE